MTNRALIIKRSLILAFTGILFLTTVVLFFLSLDSFAWFSSNEKTTLSGMGIETQALEDLLIRTDDTSDWTHVVNCTTDLTRMYPATAGGPVDPNATTPVIKPVSEGGTRVADTAGLIYVTNSAAISRHTGLEKGTATFTYANVEDDTNTEHNYYVDFSFQIAADGKTINNTLTAKINDLFCWDEENEQYAKVTNSDDIKSSQKAATIEIIVNGTSTGKLTVADMAKETLDIYTGIVPRITETPLDVTLRLYFDGALSYTSDGTKTAYVNTAKVDLNGIALNLQIGLKN